LISNFDDKLRRRLDQLETILTRLRCNVSEDLGDIVTNLSDASKGIVELLGEYSADAAAKAKEFLEQLCTNVTTNREQINQSIDQLAVESRAWRALVESAIESLNQASIAFGRSAQTSILYTGASSFFGQFGRRTAKHLGYDESTQNNVEFLTATIAGTSVAVGTKAVELRPDAIALRMLSYLSLPVIKRGLEIGGCDSQRALLYAVAVQTSVDAYSNPIKAAATTAGFFVGNYIGNEVGTKSADAIANCIYGN